MLGCGILEHMYDYLIIGQGLAGTILSYKLIKTGHTVFVLSNYDSTCASYIAAGLFSPITGQRIAKIEHAHETLEQMYSTYYELESILGVTFLHQMLYVKCAVDDKLAYYMHKRLHDPAYSNLITPTKYLINNKTVDAISINNTGYIDTHFLLDAYRAYLQTLCAYRQESFDQQELLVTPDIVTYKNIKAKHIIFCNGLTASDNSFFNHLRFNPTKGEILTIGMNKPMDYILSGNVFLLPLGNNLFHVGATYERNYQTDTPSQEGLAWLQSELAKIIDTPYRIVAHKAGIRPTTFGHKPFVGWHETHKNVGVFSGFGSRGVSTIPYYAQQFTKLIL